MRMMTSKINRPRTGLDEAAIIMFCAAKERDGEREYLRSPRGTGSIRGFLVYAGKRTGQRINLFRCAQRL